MKIVLNIKISLLPIILLCNGRIKQTMRILIQRYNSNYTNNMNHKIHIVGFNEQ
jgi:hypothetical protein